MLRALAPIGLTSAAVWLLLRIAALLLVVVTTLTPDSDLALASCLAGLPGFQMAAVPVVLRFDFVGLLVVADRRHLGRIGNQGFVAVDQCRDFLLVVHQIADRLAMDPTGLHLRHVDALLLLGSAAAADRLGSAHVGRQSPVHFGDRLGFYLPAARRCFRPWFCC